MFEKTHQINKLISALLQLPTLVQHQLAELLVTALRYFLLVQYLTADKAAEVLELLPVRLHLLPLIQY